MKEPPADSSEDSSEEEATAQVDAAVEKQKRRRKHAEDGRRVGMDVKLEPPSACSDNNELDNLAREPEEQARSKYLRQSLTWKWDEEHGWYRVSIKPYPRDTKTPTPPELASYYRASFVRDKTSGEWTKVEDQVYVSEQ